MSVPSLGALAPKKQRGGRKWVSWYIYRVFPTDTGRSCCSRSLADWNGLFMLGVAACCVTTGCTLNLPRWIFEKALVSPYLFAMQNPPEQALDARIIWADPGTSAWGFPFECSHVTLHPHPLSKDLVKYPLGKGKTQHCLVLLQSLAFLNRCDHQYDHHFYVFYLFL